MQCFQILRIKTNAMNTNKNLNNCYDDVYIIVYVSTLKFYFITECSS